MVIRAQRAVHAKAIEGEAAEILAATLTGARSGIACWERGSDGALYLVATNDLYLEFMGRLHEDVLGRRLDDVARAMGPEGLALIEHVLSSGEPMTLARYPIRRNPDGVLKDPGDPVTYWDVALTAVRGTGPARVVVTAQDATKAVATEDALTAKNRELQWRQDSSRLRLESLARVAAAVGSGGDLDEVILAIAEGIKSSFGFDAIVNLLDETTDEYVVRAAVSESADDLIGTRNHRPAFEQLLIPAQEVVPDVYFIPHDGPVMPEQVLQPFIVPDHGWQGPGFWHPMDACFIRLRTSQGRSLGLISVDSPVDQRVPDRNGFEMLRLFAVIGANAMENLTLLRQIGSLEAEREMLVLRQELEEELTLRRSLLEIGGRLGAASAAASRDIFPLVAERLAEVVPMRSLTLSRVDHTSGSIRPIYHSVPETAEAYLGFEAPLGTGATGAAAVARQSVISNAGQEGGLSVKVPGTDEADEHLMAVPVLVDERVRAVMTLHRPVSEPQFTPGDAHRAELFAQHVGLAFLLIELAETSEELAASRRALGQQVERLEHLNRFKDEFVANVSHELRTPLTAIIGSVSTAVRLEDLPEEERKGLLESAERQAKRLSELLENLLAESRLSGEEPALTPLRVDAGEFVEEVVDTLRSRAPRRHIETDIPGGLALITDATMLYRILFNLGDNALKYSEGPVRFDVKLEEEGIRIAVSDQGLGIRPEDLPRIFGRFEQLGTRADGSQGGVGLGLHLCDRAARALGGRIDVTSEVGKGSCFSVWLPRDVQTANRTWTTSPSRTA